MAKRGRRNNRTDIVIHAIVKRRMETVRKQPEFRAKAKQLIAKIYPNNWLRIIDI